MSKTAQFLFGAQTNLTWIAGYRQSGDCIDGSAIDMILFHKFTSLYLMNKSKRKGKLTPEQLAHNAASEMLKLVPGAQPAMDLTVLQREWKWRSGHISMTIANTVAPPDQKPLRGFGRVS